MRNKQDGIVLIIALIILVAMTMTGIVLFRQVGTGVLIAGNLGFQQAAVAASDTGVQTGLTFITVPPANFSSDNLPSSGTAGYGSYFPAWCYDTVTGDKDSDGAADNCAAVTPNNSFNPFTFDWTLANNEVNDGNGNKIRYVIHRMCQIAGGMNIANQQCVTVGTDGSGSTKTSATYGGQALSNTVIPYYRITTRVEGPRGTVSFTQTIIY